MYASTAGLSINSTTGIITLATSTPGTYTVTYTVAAGGGCSVYSTTAPVIIANPGTWLGTISSDWYNTENWICGVVPVALTNVVIRGGLTNYPVINLGTAVANNITVQAGGSITVGGATLQIGGAIANSGTIDATNGSIEKNGASAQAIPAATFNGNAVKSLSINNASEVTLQGPLAVSDVFSVPVGTFNTGGYLTLSSTALGTARVAPLPTNGAGVATTFVNGAVSVERFIPNRRAWRLVTAPLSNTGYVFNSWQNGGVNEAGKGTLVTGPNANAATNGLDASNTNTITMKSFNAATQSFNNMVDTRNTLLSNNNGNADNIGYFMFIRGDRDPLNTNTLNSTSTTLTSAGTLQTGKQTFVAASGLKQLTLIGNPYPSPVDFDKIDRPD